MKSIVITKRYNSSVAGNKVNPTPVDSEGNPMYLVCMSDERADELIAAGVAKEYSETEGVIDNDATPNDGENENKKDTDESTNENKDKKRNKTNKTNEQ